MFSYFLLGISKLVEMEVGKTWGSRRAPEQNNYCPHFFLYKLKNPSVMNLAQNKHLFLFLHNHLNLP